MEIKNFEGSIRLGEFPHCIDVSNIPNNHSSYGLMCSLYTHKYLEKDPRILIVRDFDTPSIIHTIILKWDEQIDYLHDSIRNGHVLFDSAKPKEQRND